MYQLVDFSKCERFPYKTYGGRGGSKRCIIYDGQPYMLKFPSKVPNMADPEYSNSCISEFISCKIYKSLGIDTQEVILGTYNDKVVVACKDFAFNGNTLNEFAYLKNDIIDSEQQGYGTELSSILQTIHNQNILSVEELLTRFWEMFVVDAFLGNFDRHNGNWGYVLDIFHRVHIAPVYDCGSCLYPRITEQEMQEALLDQSEIDRRLYVFPTSSIKHQGKKINYHDFLMTTNDPNCLKSLHIIGNRIDLTACNQIIEDVPTITDTHRSFLKRMLYERKSKIIDTALARNLRSNHNITNEFGGYDKTKCEDI